MLKTSKTSSKKKIVPLKFSVKKGDTVLILTGKEKGKTGVIREVLKKKNKVIIEGLNIVKKAIKPNPMIGQQSGFLEMEAPIHVSNVMFFDIKTSQPSRLGRLRDEHGFTRVHKKSGEKV
ncbi:MAG: 50S ribosomal protein L24 [Candidatus Melainabacteria bacterium]|nr:50S ribosomal protein L24 [Candidatus Melainabacteria bacterium]